MDFIEKYNENNAMQIDTGSSILRRYFPLLSWKKNERVLDVGMGDGKFTVNYLLPALPNDIEQLIGCDSWLEKVQYAKTNYSAEKVEYIHMDIQSKNLGNLYNEAFDHIFSFFCLNWVRDFSTAFRNIFNMLKPGGEIMIAIPEHGIQQALQTLAKYPKWAPYGHEDYISSFVNVEDNLPLWKEIIEGAGFVDLNLFRERMAYGHTKRGCEDMYKTINPVAERIPMEDLEEYYGDYLKELRTVGIICDELSPDTQEEKCVSRFNLITIYARKLNHKTTLSINS